MHVGFSLEGKESMHLYSFLSLPIILSSKKFSPGTESKLACVEKKMGMHFLDCLVCTQL